MIRILWRCRSQHHYITWCFLNIICGALEQVCVPYISRVWGFHLAKWELYATASQCCTSHLLGQSRHQNRFLYMHLTHHLRLIIWWWYGHWMPAPRQKWNRKNIFWSASDARIAVNHYTGNVTPALWTSTTLRVSHNVYLHLTWQCQFAMIWLTFHTYQCNTMHNATGRVHRNAKY